MGPARGDRGLARRHDRCDCQRPCPLGPRFEAPTVQLGSLWHRGARDPVAALARALPQSPSWLAPADAAADLEPGPDSSVARRQTCAGGTRRSRALRPGCFLADFNRRIPLEIEECAL